MNHIDLILHKNNKNDIADILDKHQVRYSERLTFSTSSTLDQVILLLSSFPWESIAAIIIAWIARKPKRQAIFTFIDNSRVDATNYSKEELKELLEAHKQANLHLIDKEDKK
ncbi:hypothetical protein AB4182_22225 [Vibrio splendidus]